MSESSSSSSGNLIRESGSGNLIRESGYEGSVSRWKTTGSTDDVSADDQSSYDEEHRFGMHESAGHANCDVSGSGRPGMAQWSCITDESSQLQSQSQMRSSNMRGSAPNRKFDV